MRKDDVPKSTETSLVDLVNYTVTLDEETLIKNKIREDFYKSYDPNVGYNTAFVLGVMLLTLLVYVFYRTKIRKPLIAFVKRRLKSLKSGRRGNTYSEEQDDIPDIEEHEHLEESQQKDMEGSDDVFYDEVDNSRENVRYQMLPTFSFSEHEKQLPIVVVDMKSATADWVHKQHSSLEPGALILKVKSDTICPQGNIPSKTIGARSQHCLPVNQSPMSNHIHTPLNQSLPSLQIQDSISTSKDDDCRSVGRHPMITKQQSLCYEPKSPVSYQPFSQHVHLTPVIKIQNYDKSQRTPNRDIRMDSASSSSSDDPQIHRIKAERWTRSNHSVNSSHQQSACSCKSSTMQISGSCSRSENHNLLVPVIGHFTGTSRSCQNITETTL